MRNITHSPFGQLLEMPYCSIIKIKTGNIDVDTNRGYAPLNDREEYEKVLYKDPFQF